MPQLLSKATGARPSLCATLSAAFFLAILGVLALRRNPSPPLPQSPDAFRRHFLSSGDNATISAFLRSLTLQPHLAGTPSSAVAIGIVSGYFRSLGLATHSSPLRALLSYPTRASLTAHFPNGSRAVLPLTEWSGSAVPDGVVVPYHAYSPSGSARAQAVFVNFGRESDYRALVALGVNVSGLIVVARKGGALSRADVVERAAAHGAAAVLTYAEKDRFRKGFERGTVMATREGVGDPRTPGWPTTTGDPELSRRLPKIPSLPISFDLAEGILGTLGGAVVPRAWKTTIRTRMAAVGPGPTVLDFDYQGEKREERIENVFGVIRGREEPERYVLLGNHRDAWTYGAVDPSSGTAVLLDIARRFSLLMHSGWRPRRTIVLCSWDAEEFGMIGSTEWVEQNLPNLGSKAVAYLNVDCAVQGPGFFPSATPQLDNLLLEVMNKVMDPDTNGATMFRSWAARDNKNTIGRLGRVDSDFVAFLQHAGIPSVDIYFGDDFPVYHTAFDAYDWMKSYGDPMFHRHVAVSGVWGLLALRLADDSIIPFNYLAYADQLKSYNEGLSNLLGGLGFVSLSPLASAIQEFAAAAKEADMEAQKQRDEEMSETVILKRRALNDRLMLAERGLIDADGLVGRPWFKHLIYGPAKEAENKMEFMPGVADAIWRKAEKGVIEHEISRVTRAIQRATTALTGQLT